MRWFMGELAGPCGRRARHLVVLSHVRAAIKHPLETTMSGYACLGSSRQVPPFLGDEAEAHGWANWELTARSAALRAAEQARVRLWLCGHYHGNALARSRGGIEVPARPTSSGHRNSDDACRRHVGVVSLAWQVVASSACGSVINWTSPASVIATAPFPDFNLYVGKPQVGSPNI